MVSTYAVKLGRSLAVPAAACYAMLRIAAILRWAIPYDKGTCLATCGAPSRTSHGAPLRVGERGTDVSEEPARLRGEVCRGHLLDHHASALDLLPDLPAAAQPQLKPQALASR